MKWIARGLLVLLALLAIPAVLWLQPHLPAAERGRRLAEETGCLGCHGPGGIRGAANPGRADKSVPTFEDDLMMYAKTPEEVREWIRDGVSAKKAKSETWRAERDRGTLRMPAFKRRLTEHQIEDLSAYVMAVHGSPAPEDPQARHGLERAEALGCLGCHGPGGRLARPNPGSLKGYIPSWDGDDFPDLVKNRGEFEEWVDHGSARRFEANPFARRFLRGAAVRMPAYERHLEAGDLDALRAYVEWLRGRPLAAPPAGAAR